MHFQSRSGSTMVRSVRGVYMLLVTFATHAFTNSENVTESCPFLYEKGVEAYLDNRFDSCVLYFEKAVRKYNDYTKKLQNCRMGCHQETALSEPLYPVDIDNLLFYERAVKETLCIIKCKKKYKETFATFNFNKEIEKLFRERRPYEYLHICYYQTKEFQKAASAAFTFLTSHPDDETMAANLKHYSTLEGVQMSEVVNFEAQDYVYFYVHGADAYEKKDWQSVVENMEESLIGYLQAEDECRALCEGPFDSGWYPDFIPSIANHFTYCLKCKQKCANQLNSLNGEKHEDLLPSHYHYLQYAYFKKGNVKAACAAVASYLLFYPDDKTMLENVDYYSRLPKASKDMFSPRPEAVRYIQRQMYERGILKYIAREYKFDEATKENTAKALKYRIMMTEKQLRGLNRYVSEGLASAEECKALVNIAKMFGIIGDGYQGQRSPHTIMENFFGFTLNRAALLVYFGLLDPKYLKLYVELTERAKNKIEQFFKIKKPIYFTYTQVVCRSARKDSPTNRTDLSHPVHADNCNLLDDNTCEKLPPAYTWRDYSGIIYLNDDFEGGEFIFSADIHGEQVQSVIKPKCGRMVAFSSGFENLHGVRAVRKGSRFALGMWFTHDPAHQESGRTMAKQVLLATG